MTHWAIIYFILGGIGLVAGVWIGLIFAGVFRRGGEGDTTKSTDVTGWQDNPPPGGFGQ